MEVTNNINCTWAESEQFIELKLNEEIVFMDSQDHWSSGICRLLGLSNEEGKNWVESVFKYSLDFSSNTFTNLNIIEKVDVLREATRNYFQISEADHLKVYVLGRKGPCGHLTNILWEEGIREDNDFVVVGCLECKHGWLVNINDLNNELKDTVSYEQEHFKGKEPDDYMSQMKWRMEKSHRLVKQISGLSIYLEAKTQNKPTILDIGSGEYSFFRKALDEVGWIYDVIELSPHAAPNYNTETKKYDFVTMWDILEHVRDPLNTLNMVRTFLKDGGICFIRTPNLMALEREIFGRYYHSLKREHLQYFSPRSIILFLNKVGLTPLFLTSESHLLKGFFREDIHYFARLLKGSDLFIAARKN